MKCEALFSFRNDLNELPGHIFCEKIRKKINNLLSAVVKESSLCFHLLQTWEILNCIFREHRLVKDQMIILKGFFLFLHKTYVVGTH